MTHLDLPNQSGATRETITVNSNTFVFDTNFPVGSPVPEGPHDTVETNHARVFRSLAARGLGAIPEAPAVTNEGTALDGMASFYRRSDIGPEVLRDIERQLTALRPDAFSGITGDDGELPPENPRLMQASEVDALVVRAISATQRVN